MNEHKYRHYSLTVDTTFYNKDRNEYEGSVIMADITGGIHVPLKVTNEKDGAEIMRLFDNILKRKEEEKDEK